MENETEVEAAAAEEAAPAKKEKRKVAKKSKAKKSAAKKSKSAAKKTKSKSNNGGDTLAAQFGFRDDSDRGLLLAAMHKNLGKPMTADQLAKHVQNGGEKSVSICMNRIETKANDRRLPFRLVRDTNNKGERTYTLASGRR